MSDKPVISPGPRMKVALGVAILADILQLVVSPLVWEGAASPVDDIIDFGVAVIMTILVGWHWEFMPSFFGKLIPGIDLAPLWTLAIANVYRKQKKLAASTGAFQPGSESASEAQQK